MAFGAKRKKPHEKGNGKNQNNMGGKRPTYYYEHCKITGHSIERCFKIHGYPNKTRSNNNKRYAIVAQDEGGAGDCSKENQFGLIEE